MKFRWIFSNHFESIIIYSRRDYWKDLYDAIFFTYAEFLAIIY